jgi:uncharacterized membrane protein
MKFEKEIRNPNTDNPNNWKGPFYFNRKDARLIVPKSNPSMGWTLNFASPFTYLALALILAIVILTLIFKK